MKSSQMIVPYNSMFCNLYYNSRSVISNVFMRQIIKFTHNPLEGHICVLLGSECISTGVLVVIIFPIINILTKRIALLK